MIEALTELPPVARLRIGRGPRATEELLVEALKERLKTRPLSALNVPIRVVVPSSSLRSHLMARLVELLGPVAGLRIQTLHSLAEEILERAAEPLPSGGALFDVLVRRAAEEEDTLSRSLHHLEDGYGAVAGTIRELLDAGLEGWQEEVVADALEDAFKNNRLTPAHRARAEAMLSVAIRCLDRMVEQGVSRPSEGMTKATDLYRQDPGLLPLDRLYLIGFAEATGVATEFLKVLLSQGNAILYMDHPADPADPGIQDPSCSFTGTLREKLLSSISMVESADRRLDAPEVSAFDAPGASAEAREVSLRIRGLLDAGTPPERIAVVARDVGPYRAALRTQLSRLGVPWSGVETPGPPNTATRRAQALLDLLRDREDVPVDRWLACLVSLPPTEGPGALFSRRMRPPRNDLRVALRVVGASTLSDVAKISVEEVAPQGYLPLPVRRGMEAGNDEEAAEESETPEEIDENQTPAEKPADQPSADPKSAHRPHSKRRYFSAERLLRVVEAARLALHRLRDWHIASGHRNAEGLRGLPISKHREHLMALIKEDLGWMLEVPGVPEVQAALSRVDHGISGTLPMTMDEFVLLVHRAMGSVYPHPLGGEGGGIQILGVQEASERTFSHLFVMGLNRDQFPKPVREDPLLPDDVRWVLKVVIEHLPIRRTGFDAERYLFASLMSAAPHLCLSWQRIDEDGRERPMSPLLQRLLKGRECEPVSIPPLIPGVLPDLPDARLRVRPAMEQAVIAGMHASRALFAATLPLAFQEAGIADPQKVARARVAILDELDPDRRSPEGWQRFRLPGPYLGFIGPVSLEADPRREAPFLTLVENIAGCGWQVMLERVLKLEDVPDPTLALPGFERHLVGSVVHRSLEQMARDAFAAKGQENPIDLSVANVAVKVDWPNLDYLSKLVQTVAEETIRNRGVGIAGFASVLASHALPLLEIVRLRDWADPNHPVFMLGVEVPGRVELSSAEGQPRSVPFVADRVDAGMSLTEYKTGKTISGAKTEATRQKHLLKHVQMGERLQAMAYVLATHDDNAQGRFFFVGPRVPDEARVFPVSPQDGRMKSAFMHAANTVLDAWEQGALFPRLVEPREDKEPMRCRFCQVSSACSRRDSGVRSRLSQLAEAWEEVPPHSKAERTFQQLWKLRLAEGI